MRTHPSLLLCCLLGLVAGCDKSGIHDLGVRIDTATNCFQSSWLRSTPEGTEVIYLGASSDEPMVVATASEGVCFARTFVARDTSARVEVGTYHLDVAGQGEFLLSSVSTLEAEPEVRIANRTGAVREDMSPCGRT
jgi:hypothetical protein